MLDIDGKTFAELTGESWNETTYTVTGGAGHINVEYYITEWGDGPGTPGVPHPFQNPSEPCHNAVSPIPESQESAPEEASSEETPEESAEQQSDTEQAAPAEQEEERQQRRRPPRRLPDPAPRPTASRRTPPLRPRTTRQRPSRPPRRPKPATVPST